MKIKKKVKRDGIIVLTDTRETNPIQFMREESIVGFRRTKLEVGDYQALFPDGSCSQTVFERKSIPDLWGTLTRGHDRFKKELQRAKESDIKLVLIVENSFSTILQGFDRSRYSGPSMAKRVWTFHHKHGLEIVFCNGRLDMANYMSWAFITELLHKERS